MLDTFNVYQARIIHVAAVGYIALRKQEIMESSRMLVRPALEAMFRLEAVKKNGAALYRIIYTEHSNTEKWAKLGAVPPIPDVTEKYAKEREQIREVYQQEFPEHELKDAKISIDALATIAGAKQYYDGFYRLYCRFTHGTLDAAAGELEEFQKFDDRAMGISLIVGIEAVVRSGGSAPEIDSLREEFFRFLASPDESKEEE